MTLWFSGLICTPDRRQLETDWRQMEIENTVSSDF